MATKPVVLGKPGPRQFGYVAGYNHQTIEVYAPGLYPAREMAVEFFHPTKARRGEVWVVQVERPDGTKVVHHPDM